MSLTTCSLVWCVASLGRATPKADGAPRAGGGRARGGDPHHSLRSRRCACLARAAAGCRRAEVERANRQVVSMLEGFRWRRSRWPERSRDCTAKPASRRARPMATSSPSARTRPRFPTGRWDEKCDECEQLGRCLAKRTPCSESSATGSTRRGDARKRLQGAREDLRPSCVERQRLFEVKGAARGAPKRRQR